MPRRKGPGNPGAFSRRVLGDCLGAPAAARLLRAFTAELLGLGFRHVEHVRALARVLEGNRDSGGLAVLNLVPGKITHEHGLPRQRILLAISFRATLNAAA